MADQTGFSPDDRILELNLISYVATYVPCIIVLLNDQFSIS